MKKLIALAALVVVSLLLLQQGLGRVADRRGWRYFPDMDDSAAYRTQSPNPYFPGGMTQQQPPAGTIARGRLPLAYGLSEEEAERAGRELLSPWNTEHPFDEERGRKVYTSFCAPCHGNNGQGRGPVVQRGYPPPPSLLEDRARNLPDGQIFYLITLGFRNMPAYGSLVEEEDRWQAIAFLRTLQGRAP